MIIWRTVLCALRLFWTTGILLLVVIHCCWVHGVTIRIGSRPSPLAMIQAKAVATKIMECYNNHNAPNTGTFRTPRTTAETTTTTTTTETIATTVTTTIIPISAGGDSKGGIQDLPLAKSMVDFTGALDQALLNGEIDIAVHSLKDVPPARCWKNKLQIGEHDDEDDDEDELFVIACLLPREDPLDVLVGPYPSIQSIPNGSRIGTSSIRRQAQLLSLLQGKNVQLVNIRGNLERRLQALNDEQSVDALILARAGLNRLMGASNGYYDTTTSKLSYTSIPTEEMLPGLCQGIVAAVYRRDNAWNFGDWLQEDVDASIAASAERAFLDSLGQSAPWNGRPPLAGLMERKFSMDSNDNNNTNKEWHFRGLLARPDGTKVLKTEVTLPSDCTKQQSEDMGRNLGLQLLDKAGPNFYD